MKLYRSGMVQRYHSNPDFARFGQTNAAHQWGVVALIFALNPKPSIGLIKAAAFHDVGELVAGDLPQPFKAENPHIASLHRDAEHRHRDELTGFAWPELTQTETAWLALCDRLEAYLFAVNHNETATRANGWPEGRTALLEAARGLGCLDAVIRMLK